MKRKNDINGIIKAFIFIGFSAFYAYALVTGKVRQYVHPRIDPYLIFSSVVMWVIAGLYILEHIRNKKPKDHLAKSNYRVYLFYIIPLIMAFAFQPRAINTSNSSIVVGSADPSNTATQSTDVSQNTGVNELDDTEEAEDTSIELKEGVIVMDEEHFYSDMNEIYANPSKYVGLPIEVIGAVFKDESQFGKDEFVPSRNLMTCCAADTVSIGLLCQYKDTDQLEVGSWVRVRGTVELSDFNGESMPIIKVTSVEATEKPIEDFIYPY